MQPTLVNDFYLATNRRIGAWSVGTEPPTMEQQTNANIIRSFFLNEGWTLNAICGMLGCMQGESTINPAFIEQTNRWRLPNAAENLSDVPNSVAKNYFNKYYGVDRRGFGMGLVQWDGYTNVQTNPPESQQKMVCWAIANNIDWYDGWTQMYKIRYEWQYDAANTKKIFFYPVRYSGITYTFDNFPTATAPPETLAAAWTSGYERNAGGVGFRGTNARWWYNHFVDPDAPPVIPPGDYDDPTEADPDEPPFDPEDPVDPGPPVSDHASPSLITVLVNKRKGLLKWKRG